MEAMFKISVPDGNNVFWDDVRVFLQEIVSDYNDEIEFSVSGPILSAEEQNLVFAEVSSSLDYMPDHYIQFGLVENKTYCSLIPVKPAKINEAVIGVASCREGDGFYYAYGCILAFARALKDKELEKKILMCDPKAARWYFEDTNFDMIY